VCCAGRERTAVLVARHLVERCGVRLADLEQAVGDRDDEELVVAVCLLRRVAPRRVPARFRLVGLVEEVGVVRGEERELALDDLVERPASPEPHTSSS